ncbi:MAG TPA: hypothetical protein VGJ00_06240 [Rhabdochlamydiaceae bacterium]|jgi:hypothetical protein
MTRLKKGLFSTFYALCLLASCSGLEQSEQDKMRRNNAKGEFILRNQDECHYAIEVPKNRIRECYSWEKAYSGNQPKITKEFFRCKGNNLNPSQGEHFDCGGSQKHSLPLRDNKEFIYPILIELLNYVQEKTKAKVIITCGHRCVSHNTYADASSVNQNSKHLIGAEVDFYVQGYQNKPQEIIDLLMRFYQESPRYQKDKQYQIFQRLEKQDGSLATAPWLNKEILIKLNKKEENRDFDNRHSYPYLTIQVRFDSILNEKVVPSWQKANAYERY